MNQESSFKKNKENLYSLFLRLNSRAFTLVELLVVIAIMAIIGAFALVNYGSFGEDQNLKNAVLNLQSQLRAAQTNATTNVKCINEFGAKWKVVASSTTINLACEEPSGSQSPFMKGLKLGDNIRVDTVSGSASGVGSSCPTTIFFIISFAPLSGRIDLGGVNCTSLTITLRNNKISTDCTGANLAKCKQITIEQGGRIYAQ